MLIVEELYLLLMDDEGKPESAYAQNGYALAAAAITDLMLYERVTVDSEKNPKVRVLSPVPVGHPALDAALERIVGKDGKPLKSLVSDAKVGQEERVADALVAAGVLHWGDKGFFGMGKRRTPVVDPRPEEQLRARLAGVLAGQQPPRTPDVTLLAVLQGIDAAVRILSVESGGLKKKALKARIEQVAAQSPAGDAVARAVQEMNMVMMSAVMIPVIISAGN